MEIAIMYGNYDINDAEHTIEVIQNEASYYGVPHEQIGKKKVICGETVFHFFNIEKDEKWVKRRKKFDKAYLSQDLNERFGEKVKSVSEQIVLNNRPTQTMVEYVKDLEAYIDREKKKAYVAIGTKVVEETVEAFKIDKGVYFSKVEVIREEEREEVHV